MCPASVHPTTWCPRGTGAAPDGSTLAGPCGVPDPAGYRSPLGDNRVFGVILVLPVIRMSSDFRDTFIEPTRGADRSWLGRYTGRSLISSAARSSPVS